MKNDHVMWILEESVVNCPTNVMLADFFTKTHFQGISNIYIKYKDKYHIQYWTRHGSQEGHGKRAKFRKWSEYQQTYSREKTTSKHKCIV